MRFPDHIERTVEIAHPPGGTVWAALSTAEGLGALVRQRGDDRPVARRRAGTTWTDGHTADMHVERVEEPTVLGFTWQIDGLTEDDPRRTYVEFTLEPVGAGARPSVVKNGVGQLPKDACRKAYDVHTKGWASELGELVGYLDAA